MSSETPMVKIRNIANQKTSEVPAETWERNKRKWKGVFEVLEPVRVPDEVKKLQEKKKAGGSKPGAKTASKKDDQQKLEEKDGEEKATTPAIESPANDQQQTDEQTPAV